MRTVRCTTSECPSRGLVRTVPDRRAGAGVVYRPDLYCADCGYALPDVSDPRTEKAVTGPSDTRARKSTTKRKG